MNARIVGTLALTGAVALALAAAPAPTPEPARQTEEDVTKAEKAAKKHLEDLKGGYGAVTLIRDESLTVTDDKNKEWEFKVPFVKPTIDGKESEWAKVKKDDKVTVFTDNANPNGKVTKVEINAAASDAKKAAEGKFVKYTRDESLEKTLPNHIFFAVLFRQYPVGRVPPMGLKPSNVFAVDKDGKVKVLTDTKGLEELFKASVTAKDEAKAKDAARAWLRLSQEFVQDGFYKFKLMDDATKVMEEKGNKVASGTVVVMQGGSGMIEATLTFDEKGQLAKAVEDVKVKPGPRPICQATKLLDTDPIVRRMAEQDLLIMGRAARPYLDEQRARATPELQNAIDRLWERIEKEDR
jgi:hypothetical protein